MFLLATIYITTLLLLYIPDVFLIHINDVQLHSQEELHSSLLDNLVRYCIDLINMNDINDNDDYSMIGYDWNTNVHIYYIYVYDR